MPDLNGPSSICQGFPSSLTSNPSLTLPQTRTPYFCSRCCSAWRGLHFPVLLRRGLCTCEHLFYARSWQPRPGVSVGFFPSSLRCTISLRFPHPLRNLWDSASPRRSFCHIERNERSFGVRRPLMIFCSSLDFRGPRCWAPHSVFLGYFFSFSSSVSFDVSLFPLSTAISFSA